MIVVDTDQFEQSKSPVVASLAHVGWATVGTFWITEKSRAPAPP